MFGWAMITFVTDEVQNEFDMDPATDDSKHAAADIICCILAQQPIQ